MKIPKVAKGYLQMLVVIAEHDSRDIQCLKGLHASGGISESQDISFIDAIRAAIQNELGDKEGQAILAKYGLKYEG